MATLTSGCDLFQATYAARFLCYEFGRALKGTYRFVLVNTKLKIQYHKLRNDTRVHAHTHTHIHQTHTHTHTHTHQQQDASE